MSANTPLKPKKGSLESAKYRPNATTPQPTKQTSRARLLPKEPKTDPAKRHSGDTPSGSKPRKASTAQPALPTLRRFSELTPKSRSASKSIGIKESASTPEFYKPVNIGTPMSFSKKRSNETAFEEEDPFEEEDSSVVVAVRVRPLNQREINDPSVKSVVEVNGCTVKVNDSDGGSSHQFVYDHCFWSADRLHLQYADQQKVYETVAQPLLDKAFQGYNTCLFAYGQTGSGKSYSIMGQPDWDAGIVTRFAQELFERIACSKDPAIKMCVEISFFEIYNEKIHDLLASDGDQNKKKAPMRVREHPVLGPYVVDLSTFVVTCYDDLASWLSMGNKQRATASTGMNEKSSRSHSVFTIVVTQTEQEFIDGEPQEHSRKSKINLVDLAGSERINISQTAGVRTKEGVSINKSLLTLGKVISQLAETSSSGPSKKIFVPYRESVLTWLLKESLGGNSKTTMLATISPASTHVEETLSTLRYAKQASSIVNVARVNEDPKARLIRVLRAEIEKLLGQQNIDAPLMFEAAQGEIQALRERLRDSEQLLQEATQTWTEKLEQASKRKAEEAENLQKVGIAFQINNQLPNLVNLNEDPQLSETLLYLLRKGDTRVGRMHLNSSQNIQLKGTFILDYHCTISNVDDVVTLVPNNEGHTYINGHLIAEPTRLVHGDRVILGGEHYFRFNNPLETRQGSRESGGVANKDFLYAKSELLSVQEAQMKAALEKEREQTKREMLQEIEAIKSEAEMEIGVQRSEFENRIKELNEALEARHQEIENAESKRFELELQNRLLQQNICIDKQQTMTEDGGKLDNLEPRQTNFLDEIMQYLTHGDGGNVKESDKKTTGEIGLYELSVMVNEANHVVKELGKKLVFCQWDRLTEEGLEIIVKVQDTAQNLKLEWPVPKFVEKLAALRQILEDQEEFDLFDSGDVWTRDEHLSLSYSSKMLDSFRRAPASLNDSDNSNASFSFMDANDSVNLVAGRRSILPRRKENAEAKVYATCREQCASLLESFKESCPLRPGSVVTSMLQALMHLHHYEDDLKDVLNSSIVQKATVCQLTTGLGNYLGRLTLTAAKMSTLFSIRIRMVCDLGEKLAGAITKVGNAVVFIIQGMETESDSLVEESIVKLGDAVLQCSEVLGQVTASLGISLQHEGSPVVEGFDPTKGKPDMSTRFIRGMEAIVQRAVRSALEGLEDVELRVNMLADESFFGKMKDKENVMQFGQETVIALRRWTSKFCEIQNATSEKRSRRTQYVLLISTHSQQVIINISGLTEAISSAFSVLESYVKGDFLDLMAMLCHISDIREAMDVLSSSTYLQLDSYVTTSSPKTVARTKATADTEKKFKELQELNQCVTSSILKLKKTVFKTARSDESAQQSPSVRSTLTTSLEVRTRPPNASTSRSGQLFSRPPKSVSFLSDMDVLSSTQKARLSKSSIWSCSETTVSTMTNGSSATLSGFSSLQIEDS